MINKELLQHCHQEGFQDTEIYGAYKVFFGTLVSESRLKIINLLRHGKRNVTELVTTLGLDQTAVSHDLARLKKCGFVKTEVEGKYHYYMLNENTIKPLMQLIDTHMSHYCIHILRGVKQDAA